MLAKGALVMVFTRNFRDNFLIQYYVKYDDRKGGTRIRLVDPATGKRWARGSYHPSNFTPIPVPVK